MLGINDISPMVRCKYLCMSQSAAGRASQRTIMIESFLWSPFCFVYAVILDRNSVASICFLVGGSVTERYQGSVLVETVCLPLGLPSFSASSSFSLI